MGSGGEVIGSFMKLVFHRSPSAPDAELANGRLLPSLAAISCLFLPF